MAYLDDGISDHKTKDLAIQASHTQRKDLSDAGFVFSDGKCHWEPVQIGEWLGFVIDTIRFVFKVPAKKVERIEHYILQLSNEQRVT